MQPVMLLSVVHRLTPLYSIYPGMYDAPTIDDWRGSLHRTSNIEVNKD